MKNISSSVTSSTRATRRTSTGRPSMRRPGKNSFRQRLRSSADARRGTVHCRSGPPADLVLPATLANLLEVETYGGTLAVNWQPIDRWRVQNARRAFANGSGPEARQQRRGSRDVAGNSPQSQAAIRSYIEPAPGVSPLYRHPLRSGSSRPTSAELHIGRCRSSVANDGAPIARRTIHPRAKQ
jgi:hypothetical protein